MRIRLTSGLLTPLAVAGAVLCTLPSNARAWDEDRVQSEIQPYFGAWTGMYMSNNQDLNDLVGVSDNFFTNVHPALGGSLGVAYGRLHVGFNGGYQFLDGDRTGIRVKNSDGSDYITPNYYYRYQVIPLDVNIDVALLPNKTPVNLLVGGSVGIGMVGMQLPFNAIATDVDSGTRTSYYRNDWNWNSYLLATIYAGGRINLARRLNLEVQIGWRFLKSDEVDLSNGYVYQQLFQKTVDSTGKVTSKTYSNNPIDLSAPYVRADIRWTFSSQQERDEALSAQRVRRIHDILAMTPRFVVEHQD